MGIFSRQVGVGGSVATGEIEDNAVTLAKMAGGTDGNLITYDASGDPAAVATGTVGQVLTSGGVGVAPTMQTLAVTTAEIVADAIDGTLLADNAVDSEHYTDRSIDTIHIGLNQITLAEMAGGTDGNLITYDASGDPAAVPTGTIRQVLKSGGAGAVPTFQNAVDVLIIPATDETSVVTAGTNKFRFRMPFAMTITDIKASLNVAGTGAALLTVDIHESGTTILSTKLTFDATETTTETAATARVISDTALADDAIISIDVDTADTDGVAVGLKVTIIGYQT